MLPFPRLAAVVLTALPAWAAAQQSAPFAVGDAVEFEPFGGANGWKAGRVTEVLGVYGGCANYRVAYAAADQAWRGPETVACGHVRAAQRAAGGTPVVAAGGTPVVKDAAAPAAPSGARAAPPLGTYRCTAGVARDGMLATEARTEFRLVSATAYAVGTRSYPYTFDAATGEIRWLGGPWAEPYPTSRTDAASGWIGIDRRGERWGCRRR